MIDVNTTYSGYIYLLRYNLIKMQRNGLLSSNEDVRKLYDTNILFYNVSKSHKYKK